MESAVNRRICIVGAGSISTVHVQALKTLDLPIAAIVDPSEVARARLAEKCPGAKTYASVNEAVAAGGFERAHVLVPPDFHETAAIPLLRAGKAVLVEKPLATSVEGCDRMISAAMPPALLGVNQNFVNHPAFARLRQSMDNFLLGRPRFVSVLYHVPLRQLAARQLSHWMFREPRNILLEQAVHPLSQILALCGEIGPVQVVGGKSLEIAPGTNFYPSFTASMEGSAMPASLRFAVGQNFPIWRLEVICDDGVLTADILGNRFWTIKRTRWMDAVDGFVSGHASAAGMIAESWKNVFDFARSSVGLSGRNDAFFKSMTGSIASFHAAVDANKSPPLDGAFGRNLVALCDRIAVQIFPEDQAPAQTPSVPSQSGVTAPDVAVLGGTGFIGAALVSRLLRAGQTVSIMSRNLENLPAVFRDERIRLHRGDIHNAADVGRAIAGARCVINLAHGGGGGTSWEETKVAMVDGAEVVARTCLAAGTARLIHAGSIAALYLGPQEGAVTGSTPPDPHAESRAFYARAKALCDARLMQMHREDGLPVCILRPGLVIGEGTSSFHSGLGFFNNEQHCIGWNAGRNPLPFVLVEDVADAFAQACSAQDVIGKSYNLAGDVRPSAREYIAALAQRTRRPLKFHGKSARGLYLDELAKWCVKRVGGRAVPLPSLRDILSRGLTAPIDCSDAKQNLGWTPVSETNVFYEHAFKSCENI